MSLLTFDWAPTERTEPARRTWTSINRVGREKEFRSALDSYIAGYAAAQMQRRRLSRSTLAGDVHVAVFGFVARLLAAVRQRIET
jgi:hypothetical protein